MSDEKALDKIDIANELKTLSPIEERSLELSKLANEAEIVDKATYGQAKKLRKELVGHRTATKELRLTFTRKLDNLKDQFIKKQDEVLQPSIAGEDVIKGKIAAWEKEETERKAAEEKRIEEICMKLTDVLIGLKRKESTLDDVKRARAALKMERGLLSVNDRNKKFIKDTVDNINEKLDEVEQFIIDRIEQERIAEEQRVEQERLDAERKKFEDEKAQQEALNAQANMQADKDRLEYRTSTPFALDDKDADEANKPMANLITGAAPITNHGIAAATTAAKKVAEATDEHLTRFLQKQGFDVDPRNVQATVDLIKARGYRLIVENENIPTSDMFFKTKRTYLFVKVIDQTEFTTEARMKLDDDGEAINE